MQEGYEDIQAEGAELIAISADPIATVTSTQRKLRITYSLLSDENTKTIDAYNVIDPSDTEVARPVTYIIDSDGRVVWKYLDTKSGKRIGPDRIVAQLNKF